MYQPPWFKTDNDELVWQFMQAHPFVTICATDESGRVVATHVPVMVELREREVWLTGHIRRKTDHFHAFALQAEVLVMFTGAHGYVSASWYEDPKVASTWNYQAVHARGTIMLTDQDRLLEILAKQTEHFERDPDSPALVKYMDPQYLETKSRALAGFEIRITDIQHIFKLSQNKTPVSRAEVMRQLEQLPDAASKNLGSVMQAFYRQQNDETH